MRLAIVAIMLSSLGCATTGGRVSGVVAGVAAGALVANTFRTIGCDDEDAMCRDDVRTTGFVIAGVALAGLITAIAFETHAAGQGAATGGK